MKQIHPQLLQEGVEKNIKDDMAFGNTVLAFEQAVMDSLR